MPMEPNAAIAENLSRSYELNKIKIPTVHKLIWNKNDLVSMTFDIFRFALNDFLFRI